MPLAVARRGSGPDLVLVHGWGLGPRAWDPVVSLLAVECTVHVVALPGYGRSAPSPQASLAELADALIEVLPPKAALCGWSLGGLIALTCAERHPARVGRLTLVGSNARFSAVEGWPEAYSAARLVAFAEALERDPGDALKQFSLLIHQGDAKARQAARALAGCLDKGLPADPATLAGGLALLAGADLRHAAAQLRAPVLLMHGSADRLMPLVGAQRLAALLPAGQLMVFPDAGHAPFASDPERFAAALAHFVKSAS